MKKKDQTIADFGKQWTEFIDNGGYYGSLEMLHDIIHPLLSFNDINGKQVADIGSGSGRIVNMLLAANAEHVTAIEPSDAYDVLCKNVTDSKRVTALKIQGEELPPSGLLDLIFSIGVLHHIPEPDLTVSAAFAALRPGGKFMIWLYGKEGNTLYLLFSNLIRPITKRIPHKALVFLTRLLDIPLALYIKVCRKFAFPMHHYMVNILGKLSADKRQLVIYDQLNPHYAKYYTRTEAIDLLTRAGFIEVNEYHRHEYSWTVIGQKPMESFE